MGLQSLYPPRMENYIAQNQSEISSASLNTSKGKRLILYTQGAKAKLQPRPQEVRTPSSSG